MMNLLRIDHSLRKALDLDEDTNKKYENRYIIVQHRHLIEK
jgi:hypothetical protein